MFRSKSVEYRFRIFLLVMGLALAAAGAGCGLLNRKPVAIINCEETFGFCPMQVTLSAHDSYDPDGVVLGYTWLFGDGDSGEGERVVHAYQQAGTYEVSLCVEDNLGATSFATMTFHVKGSLTGRWMGSMTRMLRGEPITYMLSLDLQQDGDNLSGTARWGIVDPRIDPNISYAVEVPITDGSYNYGAIELHAEGLWRPRGSDVPPYPAWWNYELDLAGTCGDGILFGTYYDPVENERGEWFVTRQ